MIYILCKKKKVLGEILNVFNYIFRNQGRKGKNSSVGGEVKYTLLQGDPHNGVSFCAENKLASGVPGLC